MCLSPIIIFPKQLLLFFSFSTLTFFFATSNSLAQSSNGGIIFQALARDAFHNPANSRKIYIQSSIIQHSKSGLVVLSEEHITNTDYTGVFTISIGLGTNTGGTKASLEDIDWVNGPYFLNIKIAITPVSPTDDWFFHKEWVDLGTAAFGVVPYALNVLGAKTVNTSSTDSIMYMSKLSIADTSVMLSGYSKKSYVDNLLSNKVSLSDLSLLVQAFDSASLSNRINMRLLPSDTISLSNRIEGKLFAKDSAIKYVTPSQLAAKTVDLSPINSILNTKLNVSDTVSMLSSYVKMVDFSSALITKLNSRDTAAMLSTYIREVNFLPILNTKLNINDTASMLSARFARDTLSLSSRINLKVDLLNKSINMNSPMDYSNEKYPSVKAIKDYVDTQISSIASSVITVSPLSFTSPLVNTSSIVSMPFASSTTNGYLTSTNWDSFNNKINATEKATNNGIATLGADGKIPSSQIPAISFSRVDVVASEAAMLLLPVSLTGSFAIRTDVNKSFVLSQLPASSLVNWVEIVAPGTVTTVNGQTGPTISLTTADIGTSINKNYVTDVMLSGVLSNTAGTNTGDQDLSSFATIANLNLKANITDVNTSLALKANALDVTSSLFLKANASEVATSLTSKASTTDLTSGLATKVDKVTGKELSTNDYTTTEKSKLAAITGTNTGDQDLSSFATIANLNLKANITDVNTSLALKANASDVTSSLSLKANASDIPTSLASKANTTDLTSGLDTKVDKVAGKELSTNDYTTTEKSKLAAITGTNTGDQDLSSFATKANLNLKANITDVNTSLALKANASDVTSSLSLKANASDIPTSLASKANTTDLTSGLATKVDIVTGKELSTNDYSTLEKDKLAAIAGTNTGDQDLSTYATTASVALKVDKVAGKELSTNDYTTTEKSKLAAITGINTGDQDLSSFATTTNLSLKANITDVNTSLALKANASDIATSLTSKASTTDLTSGLATKVDKVTGKELSTNDYSTLEKDKLAAIAGTNTGDQDLSSYATTASLAFKVDKVTGKELSTNDYSTLEKDKLEAITGTNTGDQLLPTLLTLGALAGNATITASTRTKITYDTKGLVTAGVDATTADIAASANKNYVTDAMLSGVLSNTSGSNTGDQDLSVYATNLNLDLKANLLSPNLVTPILGEATATSLVASGEIKAKRYVQFSNTAVSPPSSGAITLDLSRGNVIQVDLAYSITGITFTNEAVGTYIIKFKQTVGSKTINFPDAWVWSGGIEPSVTTTVGRTDIVTLINDGTFYYAAIVQNFF